MTERRTNPLSVVFAAILTLSSCGFAGETETAERPNLVFILADDMGWADLGCYGHRFHETPVIDQLARDGMRFTDFYATPVCSSTRSTILTGQYSARTGITDFIPGHYRPFEKLVVPPIDHHLQQGIRTPGNVLRDAGYRTAHFGKWHVGNDAAHQPDQHGYEFTETQLPAEMKGRKAAGPKKIDLINNASLWFIRENHDRPFFLTMSHHAVHIPVEARESTVARYREKTPPDTGINNPVYAAMTEDLDTSIGRILALLDELHLTEKTIVVFASDNGGLRQTFTGKGDIITTNAPLRDEKGTLYEGGVRVPLIVRWPGVVKGGTVCSVPSTTADLLPTFCEMGGTTLPEQPIDGLSLAGLLRGATQNLNRDAVYFHYPHYHHSRPAGAIRAGDWKLIEFFDDNSLELYNLSHDIGEQNNVSGQHPQRTQELLQRLRSWRKATGARMPTKNPDYDPARASEWGKRQG
ncbi:MAG: sulfatase [Planctomycetaceae bacterium]|nr:sulfatase [Planctomycetaceae bacterium]